MTHLTPLYKKPLLLVFPFEQLAHYLRCLTLARQLAPHFDIRIARSERYARFVAEAGFETFDCAGLDADMILAHVKRFDFSWINMPNLHPVLENQVQAIETWKPALVLGDTIPTLKMAAEITGVPYVSLMNGYMSKHYDGARKMSWRYPLYPYFRFLPTALLNPLTKWGEQHAFRNMHEPFRLLRQQYGLLEKWSYADELEGDLNLLCDLPELFPQKELPSNYHMVPPLIYEATATHNQAQEADTTKPALFVSMGSTGDWQEVQFLNSPLFHKFNIITAGDSTGIVQGPHITALPFVNARQLFPHVDLVLCHGGNGTIYQALQAGIPVLCKTAHCEQEWNVQALETYGLGASMDGLKSERAHLKMIDAWTGKKSSGPLRRFQQLLAVKPDFTPVAARLLRLLSHTKTIYSNAQKKSA